MPRAVPVEVRQAFSGVAKFRDAAVDEYIVALHSAAEDIEEQMLSMASKYDIVGGSFDSSSARNMSLLAQAQRNIDRAMVDSGYLGGASRMLEKTPQIRRQLAKAYATFGLPVDFSPIDTKAVSLATGAQFNAFANIGRAGARELRLGLVGSVTGAQSFDSFRDRLRETLLGTGRRDKRGAGMFRHASTLADTSMTQLHRTMEGQLAEEAGVERYMYDGPRDKVTRPFCDKLMKLAQMGYTWTMDQIKELDNSRANGGAGAGPGSAMIQGGGWNCRHEWIPWISSPVAGGMATARPEQPRKKAAKKKAKKKAPRVPSLRSLEQEETGKLLKKSTISFADYQAAVERAKLKHKQLTAKSLGMPVPKALKKKVAKTARRKTPTRKAVKRARAGSEQELVAEIKGNWLHAQKPYVDIDRRRDLTRAQKQVAQMYTETLYTDVNKYARGLKVSVGRIERDLREEGISSLKSAMTSLDAAIKKSKLRQGTTLYRGIGGTKAARYNNFEIGTVFSDPAYSSFSIDAEEAFMFAEGRRKRGVVFRLVTRKGQSALPMGGGEAEVVLKRGQRFRIIGKHEVSFKAQRSIVSGRKEETWKALVVTIEAI
jgi:hypothetical protein